MSVVPREGFRGLLGANDTPEKAAAADDRFQKLEKYIYTTEEWDAAFPERKILRYRLFETGDVLSFREGVGFEDRAPYFRYKADAKKWYVMSMEEARAARWRTDLEFDDFMRGEYGSDWVC